MKKQIINIYVLFTHSLVIISGIFAFVLTPLVAFINAIWAIFVKNTFADWGHLLDVFLISLAVFLSVSLLFKATLAVTTKFKI